MIKRIKRKLNSTNGASISFALFAFIVATVVSLVIISAALSNAIKLRQEKENEQAYLMAQSIANMISKQIVSTNNGTVDSGSGKNYTNRYVRIQESTDGSGHTVVSAAASTDGTGDMVLADPFKTILEDAAEKRYVDVANGMAVKTPDVPIKISLSNVRAGADGKISDSIKNQINDTNSRYKVTAYMPATNIISNAGVINPNMGDYYDVDFLIEVPINDTKIYKYRLHFDAEINDAEGKATYVYWPKSTLIKGE